MYFRSGVMWISYVCMKVCTVVCFTYGATAVRCIHIVRSRIGGSGSVAKELTDVIACSYNSYTFM